MKPHKCTELDSDGLCTCGIGYGFALGILWEIAMDDDTNSYYNGRVSDAFAEAFGTFEKADKYMVENE